MKLFKIILILYFLVISINSCFGQIAYVIKLVTKQDKKVIHIIETSGGKQIWQREIATAKFDEMARKKIFNKALTIEECKRIIKEEVNAGHITALDAVQLEQDLEIQRIASSDMTKVGNGQIPELLKIEQNTDIINKPSSRKPTPLSLKQIENSNVFISIPSTELEYTNIFGKENFDKSQFSNIRELRKKLYVEKNPHAYFPKASDQLLYELKQNKKQQKSFIIIGHNDNGKLIFPDGSSIELKKIDNIANSLSKVVVFLSCNAQSYTEINPATSYYLSYSEAVKLVHRIDYEVPKKIKSDHQTISKNIQAILDSYGREKNLNFQLKVIFYSATISAIGYGLYEIKSDKRLKTKPTKSKN